MWSPARKSDGGTRRGREVRDITFLFKWGKAGGGDVLSGDSRCNEGRGLFKRMLADGGEYQAFSSSVADTSIAVCGVTKRVAGAAIRTKHAESCREVPATSGGQPIYQAKPSVEGLVMFRGMQIKVLSIIISRQISIVHTSMRLLRSQRW